MVGRWGDNSPILLLSQPSLLGSRRGESSRYKTLEGKQVKTKLLDGEGDDKQAIQFIKKKSTKNNERQIEH